MTPSTPEMFDFEDLDEEEDREKDIGKFDTGTPGSSKTHEAGVQARLRPDSTEKEAQTSDGEQDDGGENVDMADVEYIDGVMCKHLCMAELSSEKTRATERQEKDENGFYKLKKGITSDSGAGDTVGPDDEYPDYPLEESPGGDDEQKKVMIRTTEKQLDRESYWRPEARKSSMLGRRR